MLAEGLAEGQSQECPDAWAQERKKPMFWSMVPLWICFFQEGFMEREVLHEVWLGQGGGGGNYNRS